MTPRIENHPGYVGAFTSDQAEGAIPNGTVVMKCASEPDDASPDGSLGWVLGSIDGMLLDPEMCRKANARFMYWVEWAHRPHHAVAIVDRKIMRAS